MEDRTLPSVSFAPAVPLPVGLRPESTLTADLNNDGKLDIVVLNQGQLPDFTSSVGVLLGNGDGNFRPAITTGLLPGAISLAAGDFNNDGRPDLAIASRLNSVVEVLRGNGDGTFHSPDLLPISAVGSLTFPSITSVALADFQHDGKLDIAVTSAASNTVGVFLGNGNGSFQSRIDYAVGVKPQSVVAADLGNGQLDLVVANHDSRDVSVLRGNGDGTFQPAQTTIDVKFQDAFGNQSQPFALNADDFNGDGKPDVLLGQFVGFDVGESFVTVLRGNGDGTFQAPIHTDLVSESFGLAVGDFNGDGKLDFASADSGVTSSLVPFPVHVFLGNGDGTFARDNLFPTGGAGAFGVAAGDFNGDGRPDLAVASTFSNEVRVLLNTSTAAAAATTTKLSSSTTTAVFGQQVTLTATVTSAAAVPTGFVTFRDGTTVVGIVPVNAAGQATLAASLGVGGHALTASFAGSGNFADSTSAVVAVTANRANTTVALGSSVNPTVTGQAVTFTATVAPVAPGAGTPTGTVTFKDGDVDLGTAAIAGGTAAFTTSFTAAGGHAITAVYNGDGNFLDSSQSLTEQVNAPTTRHMTTTALSASINPVVVGQLVTFTATVRGPAGTGMPTGIVTFFVGKKVVAQVALDADGQARLAGFFSRAGLFTIRAVYSGDANFAASSQFLTEKVI
jgi:hypothetical protein